MTAKERKHCRKFCRTYFTAGTCRSFFILTSRTPGPCNVRELQIDRYMLCSRYCCASSERACAARSSIATCSSYRRGSGSWLALFAIRSCWSPNAWILISTASFDMSLSESFSQTIFTNGVQMTLALGSETAADPQYCWLWCKPAMRALRRPFCAINNQASSMETEASPQQLHLSVKNLRIDWCF